MKPTLAEKIKEMRLWFKAWRDQNHTVRDYRKYFKPVLCYLEGAWTRPGKSVDEPFHSDRHFVDAKTWFDLQEKFRCVSMQNLAKIKPSAYQPGLGGWQPPPPMKSLKNNPFSGENLPQVQHNVR